MKTAELLTGWLSLNGLQIVADDPLIKETTSLAEVREAIRKLTDEDVTRICKLDRARGAAMIHGMQAVLSTKWQPSAISLVLKREWVCPQLVRERELENCTNYRNTAQSDRENLLIYCQ